LDIPVKFSLDLIAARLPDLLAASRRERLPLEAQIADGDMQNLPSNGAAWRPLRVQDRWGSPGASNLIRFSFTVPEGWEDDRVYLHFEPSEYGGAEGLLYLDGHPFAAIDIFHHDVLLNEHVEPGRTYDVLFEGHIWILSQHAHIVQALELQRVDADAEAIYEDLRILHGAVHAMPAESIDRGRQIRILERAYRALDLRRPQSDDYLASVREARRTAGEAYDADERGARPRTIAVGHAHIDLAWMWRVAQTRRKTARTFSTVLRLMERYPWYHFSASQPPLYEWMREDEPELYDQILQRVKEGRWEPTGASWVEMDCNITGAESLVRQFLYGKRYFREVLGVDPKILWLPDVFGYSAAIPQVLKGCNVDYFMTTKISWNEYNRLPYDTFRWRGIDGTEVLTHMVTVPDKPEEVATARRSAYTYNAKMTPADIAGNWAQYRQKDINDELLYLYGYGDGGGGPTAEMEEASARLQDLPGFPRVEQSAAEAFFKRLDERVWDDPDLPRWVGELYLEYHRGTYTSQAWIKRANRKAEIALHGAELWASVREVLLGHEFSAEGREQLASAWKCLLFNQFHDILPGSSIKEVYADARPDFAGIMEKATAVSAAALQSLAGAIAVDEPSIVVFNPAPFQRYEPVEVLLPPGTPLPNESQPLGEETSEGRRVLVQAAAPELGYGVRPLMRSHPHDYDDLHVSQSVLENNSLRIELDDDATIASIYDKQRDRELLAPGGGGNRFIAFEDRPLMWDAWDIQIDYADKPYPVTAVESWEVVEQGPLRGAVEIVRRFGASTIRQRIVLNRNSGRIDFPTWVDWHERQTLLKVAFPVAINSARATFEIQWGNVERPTHWNTSWDWARFETCAHKWVDLSEGDYGVSLLNDCKYGHDVKGNVMRLTLLRGPIDPDPTADEGEHEFTYSLFPHSGTGLGSTIAQAYLLNMPPAAIYLPERQEGALPAQPAGGPTCFLTTGTPFGRHRPVVETIKPAEDGDGIIVRFYEASNTRGQAILTFARPLASAEETNMLEEKIRDLEVTETGLTIDERPFGITTIRVRFKAT
jgi:alpha-mannosidase